MKKVKEMTVTELVELFSDINKELRSRQVIRTKNFVGEIGEYLVKEHFNNSKSLPNLTLEATSNKHFDAKDENGLKYAIKACSGGSTGVFYGLEPIGSNIIDEKIFDFAIILIFNENYGVSKIIQLTWEEFLENKSWHSTMNAWKISITKSFLKNSTHLL